VIPHLPLDDRRYHAVILPALYDDGCLSDAGYGPLLTDGERRWLKARHAEGAVIATMCSGAYALAEAGLLDGGATAMHWLYAPIFRQRFPRVETMTRRSLVVSGAKREIITGGAAVYASDVSLCLIARFFGPERALLLAKLYGKASGESLLEEARAGASALETDPEDRVVALAKRFILSHLASPGLVGAAAELAHLDPQTLARRFHRALGLSPRAFIAAARIDRARDLLARTRLPIEEVAARVGYRDRSAFAKAFRARSGLPPAEYRRRFASPARLTEFAAE
jgi:transcriptional regulator GlxA family with amidase domain